MKGRTGAWGQGYVDFIILFIGIIAIWWLASLFRRIRNKRIVLSAGQEQGDPKEIELKPERGKTIHRAILIISVAIGLGLYAVLSLVLGPFIVESRESTYSGFFNFILLIVGVLAAWRLINFWKKEPEENNVSRKPIHVKAIDVSSNPNHVEAIDVSRKPIHAAVLFIAVVLGFGISLVMAFSLRSKSLGSPYFIFLSILIVFLAYVFLRFVITTKVRGKPPWFTLCLREGLLFTVVFGFFLIFGPIIALVMLFWAGH